MNKIRRRIINNRIISNQNIHRIDEYWFNDELKLEIDSLMNSNYFEDIPW